MENKFLIGMLAGGILGSFLTYAYMDKKNAELTQEILDKESRIIELEHQVKEADAADESESATAEDQYQESLPTVADLMQKSKEKANEVESIRRKYTPYSDAEQAEIENDEERKETDPYLVDEDVYIDSNASHSKNTCTLYLGNMVVIDDHCDVMDDIDYVLGADNLKDIQEQYKEDGTDMFWVVNPRTAADYEIEVVDEEFNLPEA